MIMFGLCVPELAFIFLASQPLCHGVNNKYDDVMLYEDIYCCGSPVRAVSDFDIVFDCSDVKPCGSSRCVYAPVCP